LCAAALHDLEIESCGEDGVSSGEDDGGVVGFGLVQGLVELAQDGGGEGVSFAVIDADGGDVFVEGVVDGSGRSCYLQSP